MLCVSLGPDLCESFTKYFAFIEFKMVTSPTGKGVIIFGGRFRFPSFAPNDEKLELTGDSIETLKWNDITQVVKMFEPINKPHI